MEIISYRIAYFVENNCAAVIGFHLDASNYYKKITTLNLNLILDLLSSLISSLNIYTCLVMRLCDFL